VRASVLTMKTELVEPIKDTEWDRKVIDSKASIFVEFWAPWCGPCHVMAPLIASLAKEFGGKVKFVKVNVDESPVLAAKLEIFSVPTFMIFTGGKPRNRFVGMATKEHISKLLVSSVGA